MSRSAENFDGALLLSRREFSFSCRSFRCMLLSGLELCGAQQRVLSPREASHESLNAHTSLVQDSVITNGDHGFQENASCGGFAVYTQVWRVLTQRFDSRRAGRRRNIMSQLLQPGPLDPKKSQPSDSEVGRESPDLREAIRDAAAR